MQSIVNVLAMATLYLIVGGWAVWGIWKAYELNPDSDNSDNVRNW